MNGGGRPSKLTPECATHIVADIGAGAFEHVAAQAAGIDPRTFWRWMEPGALASRGRFRRFREAVLAARATARATAEKWVFENDKLAWLLCGPGRERMGDLGWSRRQTIAMQPSDEPMRVEVHYYNSRGEEVDDRLRRIVDGKPSDD